MQRVILHCDMNNFYASVECMLNPELKNKPVAVCGSVEERHGIVLAKNYAAKAFGVSTGEAIWQAKQKCQDLVIVEPHYEQYMKFSKLAREIYGRYTDQIEPYGMDECWLDVTGSGCMGTGFEIADEIRRTVKFELGLTISAGVSFNKIFAKLGSDMKKPDAITCIEADSFQEKIWCLPASDLLGVGRATEKVLSGYGIHTIAGVSCWNWCRKSELSCERIKRKQAELRFPSATMSFSRRSGSAGLAFRHKALPIWRKPHFLCLQRIISGNTRFVR